MGEVHCSFMFAKSRLASEVCINSSFGTIRHNHILASGHNAQEREREIGIPIRAQLVFWTDSMSVLR